VFSLLVSIVALSLLITRLPFSSSSNNYLAQAVLWQTVVTLLLCVLVKSEAEVGGEGELGIGVVDGMMVASQFMFVPLLVYKSRNDDISLKAGVVTISRAVSGNKPGGGLAVVPIGGGGGRGVEKLHAQHASALSQLTDAQEEIKGLRRRIGGNQNGVKFSS
jgi:hypothetical protein